VHVIATSVEGTREALDTATALARGLSGRVVLFVKRAPPDDEAADALRRLTDSYTPRPSVLACVCERAVDVVQLFQSPGLVVIGGETRLGWPTAEQRLARTLTRLGCHVTFVNVPHGRFVCPLVAAIREEAAEKR
jgi:hypothetical protein